MKTDSLEKLLSLATEKTVGHLRIIPMIFEKTQETLATIMLPAETPIAEVHLGHIRNCAHDLIAAIQGYCTFIEKDFLVRLRKES